jgi:hypothetical protein
MFVHKHKNDDEKGRRNQNRGKVCGDSIHSGRKHTAPWMLKAPGDKFWTGHLLTYVAQGKSLALA